MRKSLASPCSGQLPKPAWVQKWTLRKGVTTAVSVFVNSTNISTNIETAVLSRWQLCLTEGNVIFHITHVYISPHLEEERNLLDRCARVHVLESRIISSACFHPDDDVHWGKANFAHTDTSQLSRDLRVSLQEHMFTFSKLSRPLEIKLSRQ